MSVFPLLVIISLFICVICAVILLLKAKELNAFFIIIGMLAILSYILGIVGEFYNNK